MFANEFLLSSAPREAEGVYHRHREEKLAEGATAEAAHRHALRMVHNAGWYKGKKGWKRVHADVREKINIRDAIRQPNGKYVIEDVDVFYPNATKGEQFDAARIRDVIRNTNRMIDKGGQRPGLIEGHPMPLDSDTPALIAAQIGKQFRPVGYGVNWREFPAGSGRVRCDLVDVEPAFVEAQKSLPLQGLSAGVAWDEGKLNERFDHIATLGSSIQSLSQLPRTELSEMYSANVVCFAAITPNKGKRMLSDNEKKLHNDMAECYAALSAASKSYASGEPDALTKLVKAQERFQSHYSANKATFDAAMPDQPLMERASDADNGQPSKGPAVIDSGEPTHEDHQDHEGKASFAALKAENQKLNQMVAGLVGKIQRADFAAKMDKLKAEGVSLPAQDKIDKAFNIAFSAEDPAKALDDLYEVFAALPRKLTPAAVGPVMGAAGNTPADGSGAGRVNYAAASSDYIPDNTAMHKTFGVMFKSDDIEMGRKFGAAFAQKLAGSK